MLIYFFLQQTYALHNVNNTNSQRKTIQNITDITPKNCSSNSIIQFHSFRISGTYDFPGSLITITFQASLLGKVENPFLDIQFISEGNYIPIARFRHDLCKANILQCPASFSNMNYAKQISLPSHANPGKYTLKLLFREGDNILACFSTLIEIKVRMTTMDLKILQNN